MEVFVAAHRCATVTTIFPDVTIVIPQFNHAELTHNCIQSLREHDQCPWPIIVVDDGSGPECVERITNAGCNDTSVVSQTHRGVAAAWNRGAAGIATRFVVFLNNDVVSFGPWVKRLTAPLRNDRAVLSGVVLRRETSVPSTVLENLPTNEFLEGWCFATSLDEFQRIRGFDEQMAVYWSDTDFQARLRSGRGRAASCPDLPLKHLGHRTAHDRACLSNQRLVWRADREAFIAKWSNGCQRAPTMSSGSVRPNKKDDSGRAVGDVSASTACGVACAPSQPPLVGE